MRSRSAVFGILDFASIVTVYLLGAIIIGEEVRVHQLVVHAHISVAWLDNYVPLFLRYASDPRCDSSAKQSVPRCKLPMENSWLR